MSQNDYIDKGQEQDCHNDVNVISQVKGRIIEVIKQCQDLGDKQAMAYNSDLPQNLINALDDVLEEVIAPVEKQADEGVLYYENNRPTDY